MPDTDALDGADHDAGAGGVGGRVFVTVADREDYGTSLVALDAATGGRRWERSLGGTYYWSGLTYGNGAVYAITFDGVLVAIDGSTGATRWAEQLPGQYAFSSAPTFFDGSVYVGGAGSGGTLYAVDAASGALRWTQPVANGDDSSPAVDANGVYVSYVFAFALDGTPRWTTDPPCSGGGGKTPVLSGSRLLVRDGGSGTVYDAPSGRLIDVFGSATAPAFAGNFGATSGDGALDVIDSATLTVRSEVQGRNVSTAPFIVGTRVFAGTADGHLLGVDAATGAVAIDLDLAAGIAGPDEQNVSQPLAGFGTGGGVLVAPTAHGHVVGLTGSAGPTAPPSTPPPAPPAPQPAADPLTVPVATAQAAPAPTPGLAGATVPSLGAAGAAAPALTAAARVTLPDTPRLAALGGRAGLAVQVTGARAGARCAHSCAPAGRSGTRRCASRPAAACASRPPTAPKARELVLRRTLR